MSTDPATAIYYTLSTISQTLAGALAVLVAFVVLRVQQCDTALAQGEQRFFSYVRNDSAAWRVNLEEGFAEAVRRFKIPQPVERHVEAACEGAHIAWGTRRRIINRLRVSLGLTLPTIGLCIVALPFTPSLTLLPFLSTTVQALAVTLSVGCLGLYAWLISSIAVQAR